MLMRLWAIEDFRDAPMRPLALFEDEKLARAFAAAACGEHARVYRIDVREVDLDSVRHPHLRGRDGYPEATTGTPALEPHVEAAADLSRIIDALRTRAA
jgi:hypothetical protein